MTTDFTNNLLQWHTAINQRSMPWKGEKDPYKIWLSEVILQQTRVEQGLDYFNRFIEAFPTIHDLANAPEQQVFKLWEGLGYYTRCKNLIATAKFISGELSGKFPDTYETILSLKGVGPYTAAAIASFAYNLPYAVLDGNVFRVLSRYFGINTPVDSVEGKKIYSQLATGLLAPGRADLYNQAIMDFGAVVCKPQQPLCGSCPQQTGCEAYKHGWVNLLPVKEKSITRRVRHFYYFIIEAAGSFYVKQRAAKDIWENLFEFVLYETDAAQVWNDVLLAKAIKQKTGCTTFSVQHISEEYRQQLTHQTIIGQFIHININETAPFLHDYQLLDKEALRNCPFPRFITAYLQRKSTPLRLF